MCARKGGLYPYVSTNSVFVKRPTPTLPVREGEWMRDEGKGKVVAVIATTRQRRREEGKTKEKSEESKERE